MKSKSTAAIIRHIKSRHKKAHYSQAALAIERKLSAIKRSQAEHPGREASMPVFGHLA